jgi:hypothetical protein
MALFSEITFSNIKFEVEQYLKEKYNKANVLFSPVPWSNTISSRKSTTIIDSVLKKCTNQFDLSLPNLIMIGL